MAVFLTALVFLSGLTGFESVKTVSRVSVQVGQSISIPCLYSFHYKWHVKYLCKGYTWHSCGYAVKTNQHQNPGRFSISDDKSQRIFTVIIKQLTSKDTDFWCNVEIDDGPDVGTYFHLTVTGDSPILRVDTQEVTGFVGESVSISCYHRHSGRGKWCRLGQKCVTNSHATINSMNAVINSTVPNVFTVTMTDLTPESGGWYWCELGDYQMPVYLTIQERTITTTTVIGVTTVTSLQDGQDRPTLSHLTWLVILLLSLLITTVIVTLIAWLLLKHNEQTKAEESATSKVDEVTYSDIKHKSKPLDQTENEVGHSDVEQERQTAVGVNDKYDTVIYSTVAQL